ncbi:copia protein [Tanacetum coccineum]
MESVVPSVIVDYGNIQKDLNDDRVAMEVQSPLVDQTNTVKTGRGSYLPLPTLGTNPAENTPSKSSYANVIVAYPIVANYVRNTWGKFGLVKSILNSSTGLFSFQFSSMDGLNSMLENGSWFIRNHPVILCKWNLDVDLLKDDVRNVPVWVKLHGVPITAFSEDGLSAIAIKLGTPLMLDSYTFDMCFQSWGRSSYFRVMIELRDDVELKDTIVVAMPKNMGVGYYMFTVRVEYEWKPPRCSCCKVFGHIQEEYPKNIGLGVANNWKKPSQTSQGVLVGPKKGVVPTNEVSNSNPFEVLNSGDNDVKFGTNEGTTNLVNNGANSSGSSFMNVENSSTNTTPITDKIKKFEDLLISGQAILVDETGNPLKNAVSGDSYGNGDYDKDPYDDDMSEGQDLPQEIQAICDNLDIRV